MVHIPIPITQDLAHLSDEVHCLKKNRCIHQRCPEGPRIIGMIDTPLPLWFPVVPGELRAYVHLDGGARHRADAQDL